MTLGEAPAGARLVASRVATTSRAKVMDLIYDPGSWPRWQSEIVETTGPSPVAPGDVVRGRARLLGFGVHGHSTTVEDGAGFVVEDVLVGVRMRVRYDVAEQGDGTVRITHDLTLYPLGGAAGRVLALLLRPRLRRMQKAALERLAAQAEGAS